MSIMDAWLKKADKTMKINPNQQLQEKICNGLLGAENNLIIDIDTVNEMKSGVFNELITYSNLNSGIFCSKKIINFPQSSYTEDCPLHQAHLNRESYMSDVFDYIKKELGVEEKMTDTDFYKAYNKFFLIETKAFLIKVLLITAPVALGNDILKKHILKLTSGLYKKYKEMVEVNIDIFESGEIVNKIVKLMTNGKSGSDIRYNSMIVDNNANETTRKFIPDWKTNPDLQDFDIQSIKPIWTKEDILKECGEIKMYSKFEDLVEDINKMIPYLRGGKYEPEGSEENQNISILDSKPSTVSSKNILSKFSTVNTEEVKKTIQEEQKEKTEPIPPKETTSSKLEAMLDEALSDDVEEKTEEKTEETPSNESTVFLKFESTKSFKRSDWINCFENIIKEKDDLDIQTELLSLIEEALNDNTMVKQAKDELLKFMGEKDLLYF